MSAFWQGGMAKPTVTEAGMYTPSVLPEYVAVAVLTHMDRPH